MENVPKSYLTPIIAGGVAGLTVDVILYPLDTIKTRLQSSQGLIKSGGFSGVYRGLGAVVMGSVPSAALFFFSYEAIKGIADPYIEPAYRPLLHVAAASFGEVVACLVRVPTDIAKQRQQATIGIQSHRRNGFQILMEAYRTEGIRRGLYRGFFSTVLRDLPFSFIQFPLWEYMKKVVAESSATGKITSLQVALCGSVAGAIAGAITTPLDVAKTRIMLAERQATSETRLTVRRVLASIYREAGVSGLFAGISPRVTGFTLGGAIFFGAYDCATKACEYWATNQQTMF